MTQRQVDHERPLPRCHAGHLARHIHDCRQPTSGGGHFIECRCGATKRCADFETALQEWKRMHRVRTPRPPAAPAAVDNVLQFGLFNTGGKTR
jgi:hypothetical protein